MEKSASQDEDGQARGLRKAVPEESPAGETRANGLAEAAVFLKITPSARGCRSTWPSSATGSRRDGQTLLRAEKDR